MKAKEVKKKKRSNYKKKKKIVSSKKKNTKNIKKKKSTTSSKSKKTTKKISSISSNTSNLSSKKNNNTNRKVKKKKEIIRIDLVLFVFLIFVTLFYFYNLTIVCPIPHIKNVYLDKNDNINVTFNIQKLNFNNDIFCSHGSQNTIEGNNKWIKTNNNTCSFPLDDNSKYTF